MMAKGKTIWKWVVNTIWVCVGIGTVVLLVAAMRQKDNRHCREVSIDIAGESDIFFVDKQDILDVIAAVAGGNPIGKPVGNCNLQQMEAALKKNVWIREAQLFFDNNEVLKVLVSEREPIARVFVNGGGSFYIDSSAGKLPLSDKFSARVPVFTGFPSDKAVLSKADSMLLYDIKTLGMLVAKDSFCMALIEQVDIRLPRGFDMVPKIGNNLIVFGDATDADGKLQRLKLFYRQVMGKAGFNYYTRVDVQYQGQVVAVRRNAADISADSLRTVELLKLLALRAEQSAGDSSQTFVQDSPANTPDSSSVQQSVQRDDGGEAPEISTGSNNQAPATVANPPAALQQPVAAPTAAPKPAGPKPTVPKPVVQNPKPKPKPATPKPPPKPRAVMAPRNDYR
jgi:cell division protein FtsQ